MDTLGMLSQKKYTSNNIHRQPQQSQTHTHNNNISNSVINHHHHGLNGGHFRIVEDGRKIDGEDNVEEVEEQYNHIEREISEDEEVEMIANETSNSVSVINHHRDDLQEESFQATEENHHQQQQTVSNELQQIQLLCRDNERLSVIARLSIHLVDRCRNLNKSKKFSEDIGKLSSLIDEFNGENCRSNCSLPNFVTSLQGVLIENKPNNNQQQQQQNLIYIQYPSHSTTSSTQLQLSLPESESNQPPPQQQQQYLSINSMIIRNSNNNNKIKSTSKQQQQFNTTTKSSIESDQNQQQQSILFKKLTESGQFVKVQNSSSSSLSSKLCDVSTESPSLPPPQQQQQQHLSQHIPLNIVDVVESEQQLFINPNEMMIQQGQSQHQQPLRYILTSSSAAAIDQQPQLQLINSISNLNSGENSSKIIGNSIISNIPIQSKSVKTTTSATTSISISSSPSPSIDKCRFKCQVCQKLFANSYNLNRHMKSHTGFQNYVCMVQDCRKRFNYNYHLKRHMETHTGARPFVCTWPDCFQRFNRKYNLNRHLWVHTDKNKFQIQQQSQQQQQEQNHG